MGIFCHTHYCGIPTRPKLPRRCLILEHAIRSFLHRVVITQAAKRAEDPRLFLLLSSFVVAQMEGAPSFDFENRDGNEAGLSASTRPPFPPPSHMPRQTSR